MNDADDDAGLLGECLGAASPGDVGYATRGAISLVTRTGGPP